MSKLTQDQCEVALDDIMYTWVEYANALMNYCQYTLKLGPYTASIALAVASHAAHRRDTSPTKVSHADVLELAQFVNDNLLEAPKKPVQAD